MNQAKRGCVGYFLFIVMLTTTSPLFAAAAATVEFIWGTAYAVSISAEKRDLEKGSPVHVGDRVVSETARVQLRFTDGGFVSLSPNSEFRVNAYSYSGKPDGRERVAMELIRGGLRTISGLIGKANRSKYEMKTNVATIGIRGTEYTVVYGKSVSGTVSAGAIAVCNSGGCLDVIHGQSYYIADENTKPVFISKAALLSPRQPVVASEGSRDKTGEEESSDAKSSGETRSRDGTESASLKNNSESGKVDAPKDDRDYDALAVGAEDDTGGRAKAFSKTNPDNSLERKDASLQTQSDSTLITFPLRDSPLRIDTPLLIVNKSGPDNSFSMGDVRTQPVDRIPGGASKGKN